MAFRIKGGREIPSSSSSLQQTPRPGARPTTSAFSSPYTAQQHPTPQQSPYIIPTGTLSSSSLYPGSSIDTYLTSPSPALRVERILERGEKGDRGERGEKGDRGERGEKGEKGERGECGFSNKTMMLNVNSEIGSNHKLFSFFKENMSSINFIIKVPRDEIDRPLTFDFVPSLSTDDTHLIPQPEKILRAVLEETDKLALLNYEVDVSFLSQLSNNYFDVYVYASNSDENSMTIVDMVVFNSF